MSSVQKYPSPVHIPDVCGSPRRVGGVWGGGVEVGKAGVLRGSPVREVLEEWRVVPPSSPLLAAMREAVDSINQYEDFEILEQIGAGFFAEVFKVRHIPTDQVMVLKLNKKMTGVKKLKEVELLKKLSHQNILHRPDLAGVVETFAQQTCYQNYKLPPFLRSYLGACVHNGQLHPLTEYMNGGTLEELIQNLAHPLPMNLRLKLALDIARGMDYLHSNGMLHRDLNSKNCLLRKKGDCYTAVVADFGLAAKAPSLIRTMHRSQSVVGNPFWMAPEVINGRPYDGKADVFSFGIILCELISRLEADPDELPRTRDYGLDVQKFQQLPTVVDSNPPAEFMTLAFLCCQLLPVKRPYFSELKSKLQDLFQSYQSTLPPDQQDCLGLETQLPKRLSSHINPHNHLIISSRETPV